MLEKDRKNKPALFGELRPLMVPIIVVLLGTALGVVYFSRKSKKTNTSI